jgi:hypothetical protein
MAIALVHHMDSPAAAFDGGSGEVEQLNEAWMRTPELLELSGSVRLSSLDEETSKAILPAGDISPRLRERVRAATSSGPQTLGVSIASDGVGTLQQIKLVALSGAERGASGMRRQSVIAWLAPSSSTLRDGDSANMTAALARYGSLITEPWAYVDAAGLYRYVSPQSIALLGPDAHGHRSTGSLGGRRKYQTGACRGDLIVRPAAL